MHNVLRLVKKTFTVGVVLATITWSIGLAAFLMPLAAHAAVAGDLIKASTPAVYYLGSDGKRYVFPNEKTYFTWYANFSGVKTITDSELASYLIGGNVTYKPGVKMVKITTDPKVYAIDANGKLRHITSEAIAVSLYGATWAKSVEDVADSFFVNYTMGVAINAASEFVPATVSATATSINFDKGLGAVAVVTPVGGSGLTVGLAASNPAATAVVTGSVGPSAALVPFLSLNLSASSDGAVKVTTLKLKKSGISSDTDVRNVYLYDSAGVRLAEYTSFSSSVVTFFNSSGLFTIPAGTTKNILVKADLTASVASGKTIGFVLENAAGIVTDGAAISGSFPISGNLMSTALVADSARAQFPAPGTTVPTQPSSVDPGQVAREVWRTTLAVTNQDVDLRKIKFLINGSVTATDLQNFKLSSAGIQIGSTVQAATDMTVTFDMSAAPYVIKAGITKTLILTADIVGGTSRSFKISIQKYSDVEVWDTHYGNYVPVDDGTIDAFTVFEDTDSSVSVNVGTLTVSLNTGSPSGKISKDATNVDLAKFNIKASGEAVKFTALSIKADVSDVALSTTVGGLNDVKLLLDGVQVGQTSDIYEETAKSFTVNFVIPAGTTSVLTVRADVKNAASGALTSGATVSVSLTTGTARGQVSLTAATVGSVTSQTLTIAVGDLTVAKNAAFSDRSSTNPTAVPNTANVKVGSFTITGGTGEASDITQIVLSDYTSGQALGEDFQNLKLMHGSTQIGTTIGSLNTATAGGTYSFTPSTAIRLVASEQYVVDAYADTLSTMLNSAATAYEGLKVDSVAATGIVTSAVTSWTTGSLALQKMYLASGGNLTITTDAATPTNDSLILGSTGNTLAKFRFAADAAEDITVTRVVVSDMYMGSTNGYGKDGGLGAATGTIRNISLWDGGVQVGSTVTTLTDSSTYNSRIPYADFSGLSWTVLKNSAKTLTVKADLSTFDDGGVASSTVRLMILQQYTSPTASTSYEPIEARGAGSGASLTGASLDIGGTTDIDVVGNYFDALKTKLTIAYAADAPSGLSSASAEQTVAKFVVSNAANSGNYTALIKDMDFAVSSYGASPTAQVTLNVYKDSVTTANLLGTTGYCVSNSCNSGTANFAANGGRSGITAFTDAYVAAGSSVTIIVTLGTSSAGLSTNETITVGVSSGYITWADDAYASSTASYRMVTSLPLPGKTLYY